MNDKAIYQFLGLAQKAGFLLSGSEQLMDGLKHKKGTLLLITEDASERTAGEYRAIAERNRIPGGLSAKRKNWDRLWARACGLRC